MAPIAGADRADTHLAPPAMKGRDGRDDARCRHTLASRPVQTLTADPRLPAPAARRTRPLDGAIARRLLAGGLAIGLLADIVLDGPALGLNVPLLAVTVLA